MSIRSTLSQLRNHGSDAQAIEAIRFLQRFNMVEREECSAQVQSEDAPSSPTHAYLAEEYDFNNVCFLITDNAGFND